jgi:hypothetical protein
MPHNNNVSIDLAYPTFLYRDENYAYIILNKKLIKYKIVAKNQIDPKYYNVILKMQFNKCSNRLVEFQTLRIWKKLFFKFIFVDSYMSVNKNFDEQHNYTFNKNYAALKFKELISKINFPE